MFTISSDSFTHNESWIRGPISMASCGSLEIKPSNSLENGLTCFSLISLPIYKGNNLKMNEECNTL